MKLNELRPARGAFKKKKRLGRGDASGHGGTSTRGHKGQKSRSGGFHKQGFEGGQMPLQRRIPKRGFTNIFRKEFAPVNIDTLNTYKAGTEITAEFLKKEGVVKSIGDGIAVLGRGEIKRALTVKAAKFSATAKQKIEAAGGTTEVIPCK